MQTSKTAINGMQAADETSVESFPWRISTLENSQLACLGDFECYRDFSPTMVSRKSRWCAVKHRRNDWASRFPKQGSSNK